MKLLVANWKANPATLDEALGLFDFYLAEISKYSNVHLVVCPPSVYLEELSKQIRNSKPRTRNFVSVRDWSSTVLRSGAGFEIRNLSLGAQDMFWEKSGPYTGEVSVDMLMNFGVTHVLVGHSDRRYKIGETDEVINKKIKAALAPLETGRPGAVVAAPLAGRFLTGRDGGITPVLLVGERNRGDDRKAVLEQQLAADLAGLTSEQVSKILITYEPVWAISTTSGAESDTPENTQTALEIVKQFLARNFQFPISNFQLLYGGSVNSQNIADFLKLPELSGAVIGGASLRKDEFGEILRVIAGLDI